MPPVAAGSSQAADEVRKRDYGQRRRVPRGLQRLATFCDRWDELLKTDAVFNVYSVIVTSSVFNIANREPECAGSLTAANGTHFNGSVYASLRCAQ